MTLLILVATGRGGEELQVIVTEDDFRDAGNRAADFFVSGVKNPRIGGRLEVIGDTELLSGAYIRES